MMFSGKVGVGHSLSEPTSLKHCQIPTDIYLRLGVVVVSNCGTVAEHLDIHKTGAVISQSNCYFG